MVSQEVQKICDEIYQPLSNFENVVKINRGINPDDLKKAVTLLKANYPEIFWLDGYSLSYNSTSAEITFQVINQYKPDKLKKMSLTMYQKVQKILKMTIGRTDYEKILIVHDYLVSHTTYHKPLFSKHGLCYTAYGCLAEGKAVCSGYSKAFQLLMKSLQIECGICSGIAKRESHAWNYVKLGKNYYWIDVTWDDPIAHGKSSSKDDWLYHHYFLIDDELLFRTRKLDGNQPFVPSCRSLKDNYFVRNGLCFKEYRFETVNRLLSAHQKEGRTEMMFSTPKELKKALKDLFDQKHFWDADIFKTKNGRKGGSFSYSFNEDLGILRISFTVNP